MISKLFSLCLAVLLTFGLIVNDAAAKRFGSGRSFGMQRSTSSFTRPSNPAAQLGQTTGKNSFANKWLGPLAGLAIGGLLASLFMSNGIGSGIFMWLLIAGVGYVLWQVFRSKARPVTEPLQYAPMGENPMQRPHAQPANHPWNTAVNFPSDFNSDAFLRDAKVQFIRLQASFDNKNVGDIREFTTPEVFAEIQLQLQERGNESNYTEVVTLHAELLDMSTEPQGSTASVRFSGSIRESMDAAAEPLNEVWHFQKNAASINWRVAGVQQN